MGNGIPETGDGKRVSGEATKRARSAFGLPRPDAAWSWKRIAHAHTYAHAHGFLTGAVIVAVVAATAAVLPTPVAAQTPDAEVQAIVDQATRDARNRRYPQAVDGFKKAYEKTKDPAYLYNVAALLLLRMRDAAGAWDYAMRYRDEARTDEDRREADDLIAQAEAELQKTHGKLAVSVLPTTAELWLDEATPEHRLSRTTTWVQPGARTVIARAPGYAEARAPVIVKVGVLNEVSIRLVAEKATLRVLSRTPRCRVRVDDQDLGEAPVEASLARGSHVVRAEAEGFNPFEQRVVLGAGESLVVHADLMPLAREVVTTPTPARPPPPPVRETPTPSSPRKTWAWVAIGGGAALLVTGSILYGVAYKEMKDAGNLADKAAYDSKVSGARKKGYAAYGLWGVGAAAVAAGLVLYFTAPQAPAAVVPTPTGVAAVWTF